MFRISVILLLSGAFSVISCEEPVVQSLTGKWQASQIIENKDTIVMNLNEVQLTFDEQDQYTYSGTLKYREAGKYNRQGELLYTSDTTNQTTTERIVRILKLTEDSLSLEMKDNGNKRILHLDKVL